MNPKPLWNYICCCYPTQGPKVHHLACRILVDVSLPPHCLLYIVSLTVLFWGVCKATLTINNFVISITS